MFEGIAGHKKQIKLLTKALEWGRIAHAYIFAGPKFVGKRLVAENFARAVLEWQAGEFHPDFLTIGGDEPIKIEQVRDLTYKLMLKPYQAHYRVALIDNAENMTVEAQNSLLKVLEEPKPYTVIILVTENFGRLLGTITSRAQRINFGFVQHEPQKFPESINALVSEFAFGRPGLAERIAQDRDLQTELLKSRENLQTLKSKDLARKLVLAYDLAELESPQLRQMMDFWLLRMEQDLATNSTQTVVENISAVVEARKFLDQNANTKLLFTNLMLQFN